MMEQNVFSENSPEKEKKVIPAEIDSDQILLRNRILAKRDFQDFSSSCPNNIICADFSDNASLTNEAGVELKSQTTRFSAVNRNNVIYLEPRNLRHDERIIDLFKTLFHNRNKV